MTSVEEAKVIPMFACGICGKTYNSHEDAVTCARKPEKPLGKVGLVYRYYDSNSSSRIVALVKSRRDGHEVVNKYYSVDHNPVPDNRQWGIENLTQEFWLVIAQLAYLKITPSILRTNGVFPQDAKIIPLEALFK